MIHCIKAVVTVAVLIMLMESQHFRVATVTAVASSSPLRKCAHSQKFFQESIIWNCLASSLGWFSFLRGKAHMPSWPDLLLWLKG